MLKRRTLTQLFAAASLVPVVGQAQGRYPLTRIAFGSCAEQRRPQPIWDAVLAYHPDLFVFAGDNVYGDFSTADRPAVGNTRPSTMRAAPGTGKRSKKAPVQRAAAAAQREKPRPHLSRSPRRSPGRGLTQILGAVSASSASHPRAHHAATTSTASEGALMVTRSGGTPATETEPSIGRTDVGTGSLGVAAADWASSARASSSLTSRMSSDIRTSSASQIAESSSEDASFCPRSTSER